MIVCNAPITVMSHPPKLVVGGNYEGGLTPAACPLGLRGIYFTYVNCTCAHLCSTDVMKEIFPLEGNWIIVQILPRPTNLGGWSIAVIVCNANTIVCLCIIGLFTCR